MPLEGSVEVSGGVTSVFGMMLENEAPPGSVRLGMAPDDEPSAADTPGFGMRLDRFGESAERGDIF